MKFIFKRIVKKYLEVSEKGIFFVSMMKITGYKEIVYEDLVGVLSKHQSEIGKSDIQVAAEIDVKTPATVKNAFNKDKQIVSDKVLTDIMACVELDGFVLCREGEKYYYVSNKK